METINKFFLCKNFGKTFVFRIPGKNKAFFMIWLQNSKCTKKISISIWIFKFTIEIR